MHGRENLFRSSNWLLWFQKHIVSFSLLISINIISNLCWVSIIYNHQCWVSINTRNFIFYGPSNHYVKNDNWKIKYEIYKGRIFSWLRTYFMCWFTLSWGFFYKILKLPGLDKQVIISTPYTYTLWCRARWKWHPKILTLQHQSFAYRPSPFNDFMT